MNNMNKEIVSNTWLIPKDCQGLRVDSYLQRRIGRISRARAQRIIMASDFLLDGEAVKLSKRVKEGQEATLKRFAPDEPSVIDDLKIEIIYEDNQILVINKPYGLSIHPSANCLYKTLTHWLRINKPGQKINPCHRIDKETSGLLLCAKDRRVEAKIKKLFMSGQIKKTYVAIIAGRMPGPIFVDIPLALQRDRGLVAIKMIKDPEGKRAQTKLRPVFYQKESDRSLIMCQPLSGRQHQIRAHCALVGHPIVGDKLYSHGEQFFNDYCLGKEGIESQLVHPRHALHALSLRFNLHGQTRSFKTKLPRDFAELITTDCGT